MAQRRLRRTTQQSRRATGRAGVLLGALTLALCLAAPVAAGPEAAVDLAEQFDLRPGTYDAESILVRFNPDAAEDETVALLGQIKGHVVRGYHLLPDLVHVRIGVPVEQALQTCLDAVDVVASVEPDYLAHDDAIPNDALFDQLYGMQSINAPAMWDQFTGDPGFTVAVIEVGPTDTTHPDLVSNLWINPGELAENGIDDDGNGYIDDVHGWDFTSNLPAGGTSGTHGTHVSGTIGATGNNGVGVAGVLWDTSLMVVTASQTSDLIAAVEYAVDNGARVSNNSWSNSDASDFLRSAIEAAGQQGHLFVTSAGNTGGGVTAPAAFDLDNIISVASTDASDQLAQSSAWDPVLVDLAAPGVDVLSCTAGGTYGLLSGTSMATPHVTGVVAAIWATHPAMTAAQVKERLLSTVRPVLPPGSRTLTGGVVNAAEAVIFADRPRIEVSPLPAWVEPGALLAIEARVTAVGDDTLVPGSVSLHVRIGNGGPFQAMPMQGTGPDLYEASVQAGDCGETVEFFITATGATTGESSEPRAGAMAPLVVAAFTSEPFSDGFESDGGWTAGAAGDTATLGLWERAIPEGTLAQPSAAFEGSYCFVTGAAAGSSQASNDLDGGSTTLTSPLIDLSGLASAELSYQRWFSNHTGGNPAEDVLLAEVSSDGGSTWVVLETVGPDEPESRGGWRLARFALSGTDLTDQFMVRFVVSDVGGSSVVEAAIDDVRILACAEGSCAADLNGNGAIDIFDLLDYLDAWFAGDADLDDNGVTDVFDLLAFLTAWFAGC